MTVDQEIARAALDYDPTTGVLTWRHRLERSQAWNTRYAGTPAGYRARQANTSYVQINLNGRKLFGHRLAFLWMTGAMPTEIDHRDMNGLNNRWANLRSCTRSQNKANRPWQRGAKIETKGVSFTHTGRYRARIKVMGVERHLGCFATPEEAHAVYMAAARARFREFAHA
jgi:hypothetical protein